MFNYPHTNINFIMNVIFIMFIMLIMKYMSSTSHCLILLCMNALVFYIMKRNRGNFLMIF